MIDDDKSTPEGDGGADDVPFAERRCGARVSDELLVTGSAGRSERSPRHDGWTPERVRIFLHTLAECGVVADAARAAGISVRSAYRLRNRADGAAFNVAWIAAQLRARRRLQDAVLSRALHGCVELVYRDGEVWAERHRFDNRLTMAMLNRFDKLAEAGDDESRAARFVSQEFDQFVDLVCAGGEGAAAFIAARELAELPLSRNDTARNLARLENYRRHGEGLVDEIGAAGPRETEAPGEPPADDRDAAKTTSSDAPEADQPEDPASRQGGAPGIVVTWLPPSDREGQRDE